MWLALSWVNHRHSAVAWKWFSTETTAGFFFCRFTQLGLLRLLNTASVMGDEVLTIGQAWKIYDQWLEDSRVSIRQEPLEVNTALRSATRPFSRLSSPRVIGDCYLMAVAGAVHSTLVTFDRGLANACRKAGQPVTLLESSA